MVTSGRAAAVGTSGSTGVASLQKTKTAPPSVRVMRMLSSRKVMRSHVVAWSLSTGMDRSG